MTSDLTNSQQKALREILLYVRREKLPAGTHLPEWNLADLIGTSRSPVRVALNRLVEAGVMRYDKNRGYSLNFNGYDLPPHALAAINNAEDPLYLRLAEAHFQRAIPESATEADLIRILSASRSDVRKVLVRAQSEGWVEKEAGYGWRFVPMIDSLEAYDDMYALRVAIEPTCILNPKFRPNLDELRELRREQQAIQAGGYSMISDAERFESNARLHLTIASWSGNRLAIQTLRRFDQIRRLAEYRQAKERLPCEALAQEHINILDAIEIGDVLGAASLMRQHLDKSRNLKVVGEVFRHSRDEQNKEESSPSKFAKVA